MKPLLFVNPNIHYVSIILITILRNSCCFVNYGDNSIKSSWHRCYIRDLTLCFRQCTLCILRNAHYCLFSIDKFYHNFHFFQSNICLVIFHCFTLRGYLLNICFQTNAYESLYLMLPNLAHVFVFINVLPALISN